MPALRCHTRLVWLPLPLSFALPFHYQYDIFFRHYQSAAIAAIVIIGCHCDITLTYTQSIHYWHAALQHFITRLSHELFTIINITYGIEPHILAAAGQHVTRGLLRYATCAQKAPYITPHWLRQRHYHYEVVIWPPQPRLLAAATRHFQRLALALRHCRHLLIFRRHYYKILQLHMKKAL